MLAPEQQANLSAKEASVFSAYDQLLGDYMSDVGVALTAAVAFGGKAIHDVLYGGNGSQRIKGGIGDDAIFGGNGKDRLLGARGDDVRVNGAQGSVQS